MALAAVVPVSTKMTVEEVKTVIIVTLVERGKVSGLTDVDLWKSFGLRGVCSLGTFRSALRPLIDSAEIMSRLVGRKAQLSLD